MPNPPPTSSPKPSWLRGPIRGIPALLQPVAHALFDADEDTRKALASMTTKQINRRLGTIGGRRLFTDRDGPEQASRALGDTGLHRVPNHLRHEPVDFEWSTCNSRPSHCRQFYIAASPPRLHGEVVDREGGLELFLTKAKRSVLI